VDAEGSFGERRKVDRVVSGPGMLLPETDEERLGAEPDRLEPPRLVLDLVAGDRDVDLADGQGRAEIRQPVAGGLELEARRLSSDLQEDVGHQGRPDRRRDPDPQGPAGACRQGGHRLGGGFGHAEDRSRFLDHHGAGLGQLDPSGRPHEEGRGQLELEPPDLLAERRRLDVEAGGGAGEVELLGDGEERLQVTKFQKRTRFERSDEAPEHYAAPVKSHFADPTLLSGVVPGDSRRTATGPI
jgi:hypothetical protein